MKEALPGKKILIGITGGIAAYKIHLLIRDLVKRGADVRVILSPSACKFVTPLSISTISKNPVYTDFHKSDGSWNNHVELALWADLLLIAPCTANTLAKMVVGMCDNFLMAVYLSAKSPVLVVPAMDLDMYKHPITKENLEKLKSLGNYVIPARKGELASGLIGEGRMAETEEILQFIENLFNPKKSNLKNKKILITAGPTYEAIDPVRFIGNHSSGKMGFAIAEEAANRGARVILISGPSYLETKNPIIELHRVTSAKEMMSEVFKYFHDVDVAIMSAAVADYSPKYFHENKMKKDNNTELSLELVKNPDILGEMGKNKNNQFLVGFALETDNEIENAKKKIKQKNLDMIVLNSLRDSGAGFKNDTNKISILTKNKENIDFKLKKKTEVASDILDLIEKNLIQMC